MKMMCEGYANLRGRAEWDWALQWCSLIGDDPREGLKYIGRLQTPRRQQAVWREKCVRRLNEAEELSWEWGTGNEGWPGRCGRAESYKLTLIWKDKWSPEGKKFIDKGSKVPDLFTEEVQGCRSGSIQADAYPIH